ncbi:MAG: protein kinase [Planctomycetes bacterium]|nr:protein kinase [Planctomycetota bacterium]
MLLQIACPNPACGVALKLKDSLAGKKVRCPKCGQLFDVGATNAFETGTLPLPTAPAQADTYNAPAESGTFDLPAAPPPNGTLSLPGETGTLPLPSAPKQSPIGDTAPHVSGSGTFVNARPSSNQSVTNTERIGRFEVRGRLGAGAFGEVFRAYDPHLDREVALKVARAGTLTTPERVERFLREAKAAANLRHPNIVPLFDTGRDGDRHFIASAFIEGQTLEAELEDGRLTQTDTARIIRKLAEALAYAHSQGIIHRDVKPANVMIDQQGEPHLMDFGLAARAESGEEKLTQEGVAMGTPSYIAPEQARGEIDKVGPASDQYSLGCTLYEMLVGHTPFSGPPAQQLFLHQSQIPKKPRSLNRKVPRDLDTVVMKCLEKEAKRRYANCQALSDDLRRWVDGEPIMARRAGPLERVVKWARRNPAVAGLLVLVVVSLAVGATVSYLNYRDAKHQEGIAIEKADLATRETIRADSEAREAKRLGNHEPSLRRRYFHHVRPHR